MKNKFWKIIFILTIFYGCKNNQDIEGYYYTCDGNEYSEVYFKNNLMRMASDYEWIKLSEWREIEYNKDTLIFETFGEWRTSVKAKIEYLGKNEINMHILEENKVIRIINLKPIKETVNFEKNKEFWNEFKNRKKKIDCSIK